MSRAKTFVDPAVVLIVIFFNVQSRCQDAFPYEQYYDCRTMDTAAENSDGSMTPDNIQRLARMYLDLALVKGCAHEVPRAWVPGLRQERLIIVGNGNRPFSVVMSLQAHTDLFISQLIADLCTSEDPIVKRILRQSTVLFVVDNPKIRTCGDFTAVTSAERILAPIHSAFRQTFNLIFATGGVKVRFIEGHDRIAERLARLYHSNQYTMANSELDICSGRRISSVGADHSVRELHWSENFPLSSKNMNALLVQTSCCYEEVSTLNYDEHRTSILEVLSHRSMGMLIESSIDVLVVCHSAVPLTVVPKETATFIGLPEGRFEMEILSAVDPYSTLTTFFVDISSERPYEHRIFHWNSTTIG